MIVVIHIILWFIAPSILLSTEVLLQNIQTFLMICLTFTIVRFDKLALL